MFVVYVSPFAPWWDSVIKDDSCLSIVCNDASECSVNKNTMHNETGVVPATKSSHVSKLDLRSFGDKSVIWSDIVVSMDSDGSLEDERMYSEHSTA